MKSVKIKTGPGLDELSVSLGDTLMTTGPIYQRESVSRRDDLYLLTPIFLMVSAYGGPDKDGFTPWMDFFFVGVDSAAAKVINVDLNTAPELRSITIDHRKKQGHKLRIDANQINHLMECLGTHQRLEENSVDIVDGVEFYTRMIRLETGHFFKSSVFYASGFKQYDIARWPRNAIYRWMRFHLSLSNRQSDELAKAFSSPGYSKSEIICSAVKTHVTNGVSKRVMKAAKASLKISDLPQPFKLKPGNNPIPDGFTLGVHTNDTDVRIYESNSGYTVQVTKGLKISAHDLSIQTQMSNRNFASLVEFTDGCEYGKLCIGDCELGRLFTTSDSAVNYGEYLSPLTIISGYGDVLRLYFASRLSVGEFYMFIGELYKCGNVVSPSAETLQLIEKCFEEDAQIAKVRGTSPYATVAREEALSITARIIKTAANNKYPSKWTVPSIDSLEALAKDPETKDPEHDYVLPADPAPVETIFSAPIFENSGFFKIVDDNPDHYSVQISRLWMSKLGIDIQMDVRYEELESLKYIILDNSCCINLGRWQLYLNVGPVPVHEHPDSYMPITIYSTRGESSLKFFGRLFDYQGNGASTRAFLMWTGVNPGGGWVHIKDPANYEEMEVAN